MLGFNYNSEFELITKAALNSYNQAEFSFDVNSAMLILIKSCNFRGFNKFLFKRVLKVDQVAVTTKGAVRPPSSRWVWGHAPPEKCEI